MERFAKIVNDFYLLIIFIKRFILDSLQGSEYPSQNFTQNVVKAIEADICMINSNRDDLKHL